MNTRSNDAHYKDIIVNSYVVGGIGLLFMAVFFSAYLIGDYRSFEARATEEMRVRAMAATSQVQDLFNNILITMKLLDEWMQSNPDRDPRFDPEFNRLVNVFRVYTGNNIDLRMVTERGGLFYLPSTSTTPLSDVSDREYYLAPAKLPAGSLYFSSPVLSRVTGKWGIPIAYKLNENKFGLRIIFAAVEFRVFDAMFASSLTTPERAISIIRADQLVLARTPFNEYLVGKKFDMTISASGSDIIRIETPTPSQRIIFYHKIDQLPIYVVLGDNFDILLKKWLDESALKILMVILVVTLFILLNLRSIGLLGKLSETQIQLEMAARLDGLTGLKNRRYFFERVTDEMERARRYQSSAVMLIMDIDHFKYVNDHYGHPEGDIILKKIARIIEENTRRVDISGRVGGEEFAVLIAQANLQQGTEVAERIRASTSQITLNEWNGSLSVGVARWNGIETLDELYKRANDALYQAKNAGRNRVMADET